MARIPIVTPENATGVQKQILEEVKENYGTIPGIYQILLYDLNLAGPMKEFYGYLNLRETSPLTKVQREMVATVVNGLIGGAP
jgi:hypothetical protein